MKNDLMMNNNKRLKLTFEQTLIHYGIVILLLFIVGLMGKILVEIYLTNTYTGVPAGKEIIILTILFILLTIAFGIRQYRRLKFIEFNINYTDAQFNEAIQLTIKELNWEIEKSNKSFFIAYRSMNSSFSWGEMITIIKDKERILINSICDPNRKSSFASYGMNKKNIRTFISNLEDTVKIK